MKIRGLIVAAISSALFQGLVLADRIDLREPPRVNLLRVPGGGIQPQTTVDPDAVLHMIYFKGDPNAGDIEYVTRPSGSQKFSKPIRVNSPGSASAAAVWHAAAAAFTTAAAK